MIFLKFPEENNIPLVDPANVVVIMNGILVAVDMPVVTIRPPSCCKPATEQCCDFHICKCFCVKQRKAVRGYTQNLKCKI